MLGAIVIDMGTKEAADAVDFDSVFATLAVRVTEEDLLPPSGHLVIQGTGTTSEVVEQAMAALRAA